MKNFTPKVLVVLLLCGCPSGQDETKSPASPQAQWRIPASQPAGEDGKLISYGKTLVAQTALNLGPEAKDPALRLAGNRLNCASCHLNDGTQANAIGFVGIARRFPAYYAPLDREITLAERISACFERSLNGKPLPPDRREIKAFEAYLTWLSQEIPAGQRPPGVGVPELVPPTRAADPKAGQGLYNYHCAACHGKQGEGLLQDSKQPGQGYTFPPVWGADSFSKGSNLARLTVAAAYIRANMPLGRPILSVDEAFDVAAFMLSQPRPAYAGAGQDYPNPKTRPVDVPYGPYADQAPEAQHRLGPFAPLLGQ